MTITETAVDISPIVNLAIELIVGGVLTPLAIWALKRFLDKLHIDTQGILGQRILTAAANGASLAISKAEDAADKHATVTTKDQLVANALDYANRAVPDAIAKTGITQDHLASIVTAKLQQVTAASPAVVTIAAPVITTDAPVPAATDFMTKPV